MAPPMPSTSHGLFITGTDTGVGKTWVGQLVTAALAAEGVPIKVRKPVESGASDGPADARLLNQAAGNPEPLGWVCPYPFDAPLSPQRAARLAGRPLGLTQLVQACRDGVDERDFLLVEGAGGFYSPLCEDGRNADLAVALGLPLLLVVGDRLGCINHALLTLEAIERRGLALQCIVLNRCDGPPQSSQTGSSQIETSQTESSQTAEPGMDNAADLAEWTGRPVVALPWTPDPDCSPAAPTGRRVQAPAALLAALRTAPGHQA